MTRNEKIRWLRGWCVGLTYQLASHLLVMGRGDLPTAVRELRRLMSELPTDPKDSAGIRWMFPSTGPAGCHNPSNPPPADAGGTTGVG